MLCERCGFENREGAVVCLQCYYAVGIPYAAGGKGGKKGSSRAPAWATQMGASEYELRQILGQFGDAAKGDVIAYWFSGREEAADAQKALADTIGKELQSKKVRAGVFAIQGRAALLIAGKVEDADTVRMVCETFNGKPAVGDAVLAGAR